MKEVKIKLSEEEHQRLQEMAKRNLRSMNKQVIAFVLEGLRQQEAAQS